MKTIPLSQGKFAIVDDEDFGWLSQWKWYVSKDGNTYDAATHTSFGGGEIKCSFFIREIYIYQN